MKNTKKNTKKESKKSDLNWIDDQFAVANVNNYSDEVTFFNLYIKSEVGNIAIYGCKILSGDDFDDFIGFPSEKYTAKDKSVKYRNHTSIIFNDEIEAKIIEAVANEIEEQ